MKLYLDSADPTQWTGKAGLPPISGITTNPTIVHRSGQAVTLVTYLRLLEATSRQHLPELMVQLPSPDAQEVEDYLRQLVPAAHQLGVRLTIKLPCHPQWEDAIGLVRQHELPFLLTGLANPVQLLWAVEQQASWVAPYVGRLSEAGRDVWSLLQACVEAQAQGTLLLAASIRNADVLARVMAVGAAAVTIPPALAYALCEDELTRRAMEQFAKDVEASRENH